MRLIFITLLIVSNGARGDIELAGIMRDSDSNRFILSDHVSHSSSDWLSLGDSYLGYSIVRFDAQKEILDVSNGGVVRHLSLKASRTVAPSPTPLTDAQLVAHRKFIERYGSLGELFLADIHSDASFVYVTPREVWKGTDFEVGRMVTFAKPSKYDHWVADGQPAEVVIALKPKAGGDDTTSMVAGTDGIHVAGRVLIDEMRDYYKNAGESEKND
jgi:hypothetical protein